MRIFPIFIFTLILFILCQGVFYIHDFLFLNTSNKVGFVFALISSLISIRLMHLFLFGRKKFFECYYYEKDIRECIETLKIKDILEECNILLTIAVLFVLCAISELVEIFVNGFLEDPKLFINTATTIVLLNLSYDSIKRIKLKKELIIALTKLDICKDFKRNPYVNDIDKNYNIKKRLEGLDYKIEEREEKLENKK